MSRPGQTSKSKGPLEPQKGRSSGRAAAGFPEELSELSENTILPTHQGALRSSVAERTLKRRDFPFEGGASSTNSAYIGWLKGRFNYQSHDVIPWQGLGQLLQRSYVAL